MVLISSKKYACETCIKGHRSSTCKHTDRPLYEIKKKGRPVTQCEHCRELRKTKQVHVKCICEVKADNSFSQLSSSGGKKGAKIPQCAAFPNGLPQELEAAVASQSQEGFSLDPSHGVKEQGSCGCKVGAPCTCWTPRYSSVRHNGTQAGSSEDIRSSGGIESGQPQARLSMSHILARVKELRPVLPRPTSSNSSSGGPVHDLSSGLPHSIPNRHHMHDNVMFSPYGRAYDRIHDHLLGQEKYHPSGSYQPPSQDGFYERPVLELAASGSQTDPIVSLGNFPLTSACGCGEGCHCSGCESSKAAGDPAPNTNRTPNNCPSCLECSYFIPPLPAAQQQSSQRVAIDEWLRQVSAPLTGSDVTAFQQNFSRQEHLLSIEGTSRNLGINRQCDLINDVWNESALPPTAHRNVQPSNSSDDGHTHASTPDHCIAPCSCPSQSCQCRQRDYFAIGETDTTNMDGRASSCAERLGQLQMSQGMSRSDTHLVLPEVYQNRPMSAPLQRNLGVQRLCMTNTADVPYSASMSALDLTAGSNYVGNSQSVDFRNANNNTSTSTPNLIMSWAIDIDEGDPAPVSGVIPSMYSYAMSNSGTDGTSSYDDLSMTLRTPL
ncbi:hypothetical protein AX15_000295 [Amanita polypyramis BW_CC]|nr:hypothetical protein AX15_000295 [Amanita polypyramis BW_CC]